MLGFLAFASGLMARIATPDVEVSRLQEENAKLKRDLELEQQFTAALQTDRDAWQARYMALVSRSDYPSAAQQQHAQLLMQQMAMNAYPQNLGVFNLQNQAQPQWCNCVPARHDLLLQHPEGEYIRCTIDRGVVSPYEASS